MALIFALYKLLIVLLSWPEITDFLPIITIYNFSAP